MASHSKKRQKRKRRLQIGAILIILAGAIAWGMGLFSGEDLPKVETATVEKETIVEKVTASGELQPAKQIRITADVSGEVIELPVKEGQKVQKGELLARINPDTYEASVEQATASLNNAKANLANAKAQLRRAKAQLENARTKFKRNKKLFEKDAIAEAEYQQIKSNYETQKQQVKASEQTVEASRYNVQSAEARLQEAKDNLRKTRIYAPINGTISKLSVEAGERVVGTRQMEGTELMRVADMNRMQMMVEVNENDIISIREGDTAEIEVDAFVDDVFKGVVNQVGSSSASSGETSAGSGTGQVTNFEVELDVLRSSYESLIDTTRQIPTPFRPGMSGMARIRTDRVKDALAVPILAVTTRQQTQSRDERLEEVVFKLKGDRAVRKGVQTGIQDNYSIQVLSGLEVGDTVISGPYSVVSKTLEDSMRVKTNARNQKFKR